MRARQNGFYTRFATKFVRRKTMHNPFITDNPHVEIRQTEKGRGVFALRDIPTGHLIAEFVGNIFESDLATQLPAKMVDHALQISPTKYVYAENRLAEIINHSCDPNCGINSLTKVVSIKGIRSDEEITWDYAMTEMSDWKLENCLCGTKRCRGTVGSFLDLPEDVKQECLTKGIVSGWIRKELLLSF
jgi:SET domain-containing protein